MSRSLAHLVSIVSLALAAPLACGGGSGGSGGSTSCRFAGDSCSACIAARCGSDADACYGTDWKPADLCSGTASAMCTQAGSASEGLTLQSAYANCVLKYCTSDCQ